MDIRIPTVRAVAGVATAGVLLTSCQDAAVRDDDDEGAVVTAGVVDAFDVRVGDCFQDRGMFDTDETAEIVDVDAVPCTEPHHNEVYAVFDLPDGDFPGDEEVLLLADEGCIQRFADFVGTDYEESRLDVVYLFPTRDSWGTGDRAVACAVFDPAGPLEGSVAGAGDDYLYVPLEVGDCVDEVGIPLDCTAEYFAEVYLVWQMPGDVYPGDLQVEDEAAELCLTAFADYVGTAYEESALDFVFVAPGEVTWQAGDREVSCAVYDPAGPLTGSVRGSSR